MITTTLKEIRQCGLERGSGEGYDLLRKNLGKDYGDNTPITFRQIYNSNGYNDTMWCLRATDEKYHNLWRHFAVDCAEYVEHLMDDAWSKNALKVARKHADGKATDEDLDSAGADARDAAGDAARYVAWAASLAASLTAARDAAGSAARDAARYAAWADARAAAWDAARYSAWADTRDAAWYAQIQLLFLYCEQGKRPMNKRETQRFLRREVKKLLEKSDE
jgi:hypothetical protein